MPKRRYTSLTRIVGVASALTAMTGVTAAQQAGSFAAACALREVQVITLIEDHGSAGDVSSDSLAEASFTMLDARSVCYEGRVSAALALYDSISDAMLANGKGSAAAEVVGVQGR